MRSLSPSTTFVCTRTESPTLKTAGSLRYCSDSILSNNAWLIKSFCSKRQSTGVHFLFSQQVGPPLTGPNAGLLGPPLLDFRVMAREQNLWNLHPAKLRRSRIVRILKQTVTERFITGALI